MSRFLKKRAELSYANANAKNDGYGGWVTDFHIQLKDGTQKRKMALDLNENEEADLFLLFVLAVAWSRTGQWENSAFFVSYLKLVEELNSMSKIRKWVDGKLINGELESLSKDYAEQAAKKLVSDCKPRDKISLRCDTLESIKVLMDNWNDIKETLAKSNKTGDYTIFTDKMRLIDGLGAPRKGKKAKMSMKILLILRELRIQGVYDNIPGELCCVPDARVKKAAKNISDLKLLQYGSFEAHLKNSKLIYEKFGDWYDIPLFAYEELVKE